MLRLTAVGSDATERVAAAALESKGISVGDRIAIALPELDSNADQAAAQQAAMLAVALGALRCGVIPVMINPALPTNERDLVIADAQVSLVLESAPAIFELLTSGQGQRVPELSDIPLSRPMHYTSGTTGRSKGVWTGVLDEAEAARLWADEQAQWPFTATDSTLVHGPFAHSGPLRFAMLMRLAGGTVLLPGGFNASDISRIIAKHQPTHAFVVPSHIQRLMALPGGLPPSPYRLLTHAGASCPGPLKRAIHSWAGADRTWEFYGSTEGQFTACHGLEWEERPGTVGRARAGRTLAIDDGVIWCQAPPFARFEYWADPQKTRFAWRKTPTGEAFSVGDLGRLDRDGYLWLEGRRDDLIITGGVNVYPAQVEAVLITHPAVSEAAVFGIADDRWGQRVCAAVIGDTSQTELREWTVGRLAGFQRPKNIYLVEDLPRTLSGKIKRSELPSALGLG